MLTDISRSEDLVKSHDQKKKKKKKKRRRRKSITNCRQLRQIKSTLKQDYTGLL